MSLVTGLKIINGRKIDSEALYWSEHVVFVEVKVQKCPPIQ